MSEPRTQAGRAFYYGNGMEHDLLRDILAIEAEAARLDVERLARALAKFDVEDYRTDPHGVLLDPPEAAAAIAAAYSEASPRRLDDDTAPIGTLYVERGNPDRAWIKRGDGDWEETDPPPRSEASGE